MQSPIFSALDSLSSPTIVPGAEAQSVAGFRGDIMESPLPAMPLVWQFEHDPFEAALAESPLPPSPVGIKFNLGDLTLLERELEEPDDETTLGALKDQIDGTIELLELVREDLRLSKERAAQIKERWESKGYLSLKLINQFPHQFQKPSTWDEDIENLISRLDVENRTETQFRTVLKLEEESLRGGILSTLEKSQKRQATVLTGVQDCVTSLESDCERTHDKIRESNALAMRRNACVAKVNSVYQTMRNEERSKDELQRGRKRLQEQIPSQKGENDHVAAKYISTKAEIEREKTRLRDLINSNKYLEEEIAQVELDHIQQAQKQAENPENVSSISSKSHEPIERQDRTPFGSSSPHNNIQHIDENRFC